MRAGRGTRRFLLGLAALWLGAGLGPPAPAQEGAAPSVGYSLLAVGDTGHPPKWSRLLDQQRAVGDALAAAHRRSPADLFVLLGDNFYPAGLRADELVPRIAGNLVAPYCAFVELEGPRSGEVAEACALPAAERAPIPIRAVLGNHDFRSPGSAALQREVVPEFVSNWRIEPGIAAVVEAAPGLSLVFFDSTPGRMRADVGELRDALVRARGPFRLVVAHHPVGLSAKGAVVSEALAEAGVPVQLWLAGHDHNLQVATPPPPGPALQIVAGAGSDVTPAKYPLEDRRFIAEEAGFARVDFDGERLTATLYATRERPYQLWNATRAVTRWSVDVDGAVREEPLPR